VSARSERTNIDPLLRQLSSRDLPNPLSQSVKLLKEGEINHAETELLAFLAQTPNQAEALALLACIDLAQNRPDLARIRLNEASLTLGSIPEIWFFLGLAQWRSGHSKDSIASFDEAIELVSGYGDAAYQKGLALLSLKQFNQAADAFRRAAMVDHQDVQAVTFQAQCHYESRQWEEAMGAAQRAIQLDPKNFQAYNILGLTLNSLGQIKEAGACFRAAIKIQPTFAAAYSNLGQTYLSLGQPAQALEACIQAVQLDDRLASAHCNRAAALRALGHLDEALSALQKALQNDPSISEVHSALGGVYLDAAQPNQAIDSYREALRIRPDLKEVQSQLVMALQYSPLSIPQEIKAEACAWAEKFTPDLREPLRPKGQLRKIGFVSGRLGNQPMGYLLEGLLAGIDPSLYEVTIYANQGARDEQGDRLARYCQNWRGIMGLDDETVTQIVSEDQMDVLIDLAGHLSTNKLSVFGNRVAPLQATWLGFCGTTGMPQMDVLIGDRVATPATEDHLVVEKVGRMPHSFFCYTPPREEVMMRPAPSQRGEPFTFGCFAQTRKINRQTIEAWCEILNEVPGSRILLKTKGLSSQTMRSQYTRWFEEGGVTPDRVVFMASTSWVLHLMAHNQIDALLDPFPYSCPILTCEALWMGVPVLTMAGPGFVGKLAASTLHQVGLDQLVTSSVEDYVTMGVRLANDLDQITEWRAGLRQTLLDSPLCDSAGFAMSFCQLLEQEFSLRAG
jgi:predicted O-linked N-acetylglucosamine transferase (SPINDLY family)